MTINISRQGALLRGIRGVLRLGDQISLGRHNKQEQFEIAWVGAQNTPGAGQIGVSAVHATSSFWDDVIEAHSEADPASAPQNSQIIAPKPKAKAQGA